MQAELYFKAVANQAVASKLVSPQPYCGTVYHKITCGFIVSTKRDGARFRVIEGANWSSLDCPGVIASDLLRLSRGNLREVGGLITGHCGLWLHLCWIKVYNDTPSCGKCGLHD